MQIIKLTKKNYVAVIKQVKTRLENHGLVVFPSDTVYGLAANALSAKAVKKLYAFKDRRIDQSVSIAVKDLKQAKQYFQFDSNQEKLLKALLPGPYTVILNSKHSAVSSLEAQNQTLGMRIPNHWFTQALSATLPFPYTATSANLHTKGPHYSIEALLNTLSEKKKQMLDLLIDLGKLPNNPPSTVINLASEQIRVLRQGRYLFKPLSTQKTNSPEQTRLLAKKILKRIINRAKQQAMVLILQGDLGAGKTVFVQGLGQELGCGPIVSPTYVIVYEYLTKHRYLKKMLHFDLFRLENSADFTPLHIEKEFQTGNLLVFEWGEKLGPIFNLIQNNKASVFLIDFEELTPKQRMIKIYQLL